MHRLRTAATRPGRRCPTGPPTSGRCVHCRPPSRAFTEVVPTVAVAGIRERVRSQAPATTGVGEVMSDLDVSLVEARSENKEHAAATFKSGYGFHSMFCLALTSTNRRTGDRHLVGSCPRRWCRRRSPRQPRVLLYMTSLSSSVWSVGSRCRGSGRSRRRLVSRDPPARPHDHPMVYPDRGVAPRPCVERTDRGREQPHQESEARGVRRFAHYRIRALLYAGRHNWDLLTAVTPRRTAKRPYRQGGRSPGLGTPGVTAAGIT